MKVFVTVGSMLPFDRLIRAADDWAARHPGFEVVAQTGGGPYQPTSMKSHAMLAPDAYRQQCAQADLIVSHVGMGTVLTAADLGKPLLALPRRPDMGEVTSDHQLATAKWLHQRPGLTVIEHERDLDAGIASALAGAGLQDFGEASRERLVLAVRTFVLDVLERRKI